MNACACCGFPVREGRQLCPVCDGTSPHPDAILKDGTPLYLKTPVMPTWGSIQLELYSQLMDYKRAVEED